MSSNFIAGPFMLDINNLPTLRRYFVNRGMSDADVDTIIDQRRRMKNLIAHPELMPRPDLSGIRPTRRASNHPWAKNKAYDPFAYATWTDRMTTTFIESGQVVSSGPVSSDDARGLGNKLGQLWGTPHNLAEQLGWQVHEVPAIRSKGKGAVTTFKAGRPICLIADRDRHDWLSHEIGHVLLASDDDERLCDFFAAGWVDALRSERGY